ncbi:MAG: FAD-binding oxidoreductase [Gammaproteobacteria bacterium]|nr:MAG: FAD-binding oxidoreductase [Gammaproteobacteria bacterium]
MSELLTTLSRELGEDALLSGPELGDKYAVDFSGENPQKPLAVVLPGSTADVATILKHCSEARQPVVVQGGLTGLSGGATPQAGELALSLERMSGVESLDRASMTLTALAGTPLQVIQEAAEAAGLLFPLDLGARGTCQLGGLIATNAGGTQVIRFGMTRNLVLGLEAVLADGTVISSMNRMLKNNAGYDLKQLFIGTEGTLGVVTRAVLRLFPRLPSKCTALCTLASFADVVALLRQMQTKMGDSLSAYEVMWASYFDYVIEHVEKLRSPFERTFPLYALIETEGTDSADDTERFENALGSALESGVIQDAVIAQSEKDVQTFWAIRDGIAEITPGLMPYASLDVSMTVTDMPGFVEQIDKALAAQFDLITNLVFGHVGDNNLHLFITTGVESDIDQILDTVYKITGDYQGSVSAEHGIGTLKRAYLHYSRNDEELELMRRLKRTLDPNGILNGGRVIQI